MNNPYDADYFLRGRETGKSLYSDYRYLPELTVPMVRAIVAHCGIKRGETVCDFGCARGYAVRALHELGHGAFGVDCSPWAVANADPAVFTDVRCRETVGEECDWVVAKDVLEHVEELEDTAHDFQKHARRGIFVVVPLSARDRGPYVVPDYEKDVTHLHRFTLPTWAALFMLPGWAVTAQYRVPGVKDNWYKPGWEMGNGFVTARRVE